MGLDARENQKKGISLGCTCVMSEISYHWPPMGTRSSEGDRQLPMSFVTHFASSYIYMYFDICAQLRASPKLLPVTTTRRNLESSSPSFPQSPNQFKQGKLSWGEWWCRCLNADVEEPRSELMIRCRLPLSVPCQLYSSI